MQEHAAAAEAYDDEEGVDLLDLVLPLLQHWKLLVIMPLLAGLAALGITYLIKPTFTARTVFLPPQQQQSAAASAIASLGALSSLVGGAAGIKSPAEQYIALLQSTTVADRLIDEFKLMQVYEADYRFDARKALANNVRISLGKKDGLITVEVDDIDPPRSAEMANRHVDELRRLTSATGTDRGAAAARVLRDAVERHARRLDARRNRPCRPAASILGRSRPSRRRRPRAMRG